MHKILLVDDEKVFLESLVATFRRIEALKNHEYLTAFNGLEALEILTTRKIDLLITDLKMPGMDGFALLEQMGRAYDDLPVIVMTAFGSDAIEKKVTRSGAMRYIDKPIDIEKLTSEILQALAATAEGVISGLQLPDFMQTVYMGRKSCTLEIRSDNRFGRLYFWNGEIVDAEWGDRLSGREAALEIAAWSDPEIRITGNFRRRENRVGIPVTALVMEAMVQKDEREVAEGPEPTQKTVVPTKSNYVSRRADVKEDAGFQTLSGSASNKEAAPNSLDILNLSPATVDSILDKEEAKMATQRQIDALLAQLDGIDGAHGGLMVDRDGMVIASKLDKRYAGDKIAALTSAAIKTASRVVVDAGFGKPESMLIEGSDGKMCLINAAQGGFFISLIGSKDLNIGMARMALHEVIETFDNL